MKITMAMTMTTMVITKMMHSVKFSQIREINNLGMPDLGNRPPGSGKPAPGIWGTGPRDLGNREPGNMDPAPKIWGSGPPGLGNQGTGPGEPEFGEAFHCFSLRFTVLACVSPL